MSTLNNNQYHLVDGVSRRLTYLKSYCMLRAREFRFEHPTRERQGKREGSEEQRAKDNYDKVSGLSSLIRFYPFLPTRSKTLDTQCLWGKSSDTLTPSSLSSLPSKPLDCNSSHKLSPLCLFSSISVTEMFACAHLVCMHLS